MVFSKVQLPIYIQSIDLGKVIADDPSKDIQRYIEFDEFEVAGTNNTGIILKIKKFHVIEYPVHYCKTCLQSGIRNEDYYSSGSDGTWCKEHYAEMVRRERPQEACPKCEKGFLIFGTGDMYCSQCGHREPHRHKFEPGQPFMCTCTVSFEPIHLAEVGKK